MKKSLIWLMIVFCAGFLVFAWDAFLLPCGEPLKYSLGSFHPYFGITEDEFRQEIATAEQVWEQAAGKELFVYNPEASFKVNLIFDERQLQTLAEQELEQSLSEIKTEHETLAEKNKASLDVYYRNLREYEALLEAFQGRLARHNAEVAEWNKKGGAPEEVYGRLQTESQDIVKLNKDLEKKRQALNLSAEAVNRFSKEQVQVVERYNGKVEGYVERYGMPKDFDQGEYVGTAITIYQFDDRAHLRLVLVHELGHALGIGHVDDPSAMMHYKMEQQDPERLTLALDDRVALVDACSMSLENVLRKVSVWYRLAVE